MKWSLSSHKLNKEPIIVEIFILQFAKLRMLELYYNFLAKYCDVTKFEELEMDTDPPYLALSEHDLYDCIRPVKKKMVFFAKWTLHG